MTDESDQSYPTTIDTLLDNALGPLGYYGAFTANIHTDTRDRRPVGGDRRAPRSRAAFRSSRRGRCSRGSTVATRRRSATCRSPATCSASRSTRRPARTGSRRCCPRRAASGATLTALTRNSTTVPFTTVTRKGIDYVVFDGASGTYSATYTADTTPPVISALTAIAHDRRCDDHVDDRRAGRLEGHVRHGTGFADDGAHRQRARDRALADDHRAHAGRDVLLPGQLDRRVRRTRRPRRPRAASFTVPAFVKTDTTRGRLQRGHARTVSRRDAERRR